jgi:hypothetical protein
VDIVVVLESAIQAARFAPALAGQHRFDLPRDDKGLQLRERCFAIRQAQPKRLDARLRLELQHEQRLRIRFDRSLTDRQTEFDLHGQPPNKQGDGFSAATAAACDRQANIGGRTPPNRTLSTPT